MKLNDLLNELIALIDKDIDSKFNYNNVIDKNLKILINEYQKNSTSFNKEKLYQNKEFSNINNKIIYINYLIMNINSKFKVLRSNKCE